MAEEKRIIKISEPVLGEEEWLAVKEPLNSGWLTQGPKVREFEENFAARHQVKHAVAVTSATTALHIAVAALDIKPGDEVIVPAFTWVATSNAVLYQGAKVVFADIDTSTFNINTDDLKKKITNKTKAIIPVHLFGLCSEMDKILEIAGDIPIIEDAACASGASYKGKSAGSMGNLGCFSFHPRKSVTTGEGGMVTTNNDSLADKLRKLRNHGASSSEEERYNGPKPYLMPDFNLLGFNYRMTDIQAAIGIVQLKKLDKFIDERARWAEFYIEKLSAIDWISTPSFSNDYKHGWQSFVIMVDENKSPVTRNKIMEYLQDNGISTRPGTHAVHMLNYYSKLYGIKPEDYPNAKKANDCSIALPLHNKMTELDYEYTIHHLNKVNNSRF
ncbi:MAG: DegT/DnrJ/EryC1/StrS family aminotransferase [Bacteroidetes bacterium]|nr:DegT/DnrJ/EryC1/StrS family aminotransferase [Bacteroidota bacterium]